MISMSIMQISLRLLMSWLLMSVFFFIVGERIINLLLPYLTVITNLLSHDYSAELNISDSPTGRIINIVATATEDVYRLDIPIAPKGTSIAGKVTLLHALVPIVILYTILCSWPTRFKRQVVQLVLGIPVSLLILVLTTPILLASHIEQVFHTATQNYAEKELPMPFVMNWVIFMETGGIWLLSIISAFLCILTARFYPIDLWIK